MALLAGACLAPPDLDAALNAAGLPTRRVQALVDKSNTRSAGLESSLDEPHNVGTGLRAGPRKR